MGLSQIWVIRWLTQAKTMQYSQKYTVLFIPSTSFSQQIFRLGGVRFGETKSRDWDTPTHLFNWVRKIHENPYLPDYSQSPWGLEDQSRADVTCLRHGAPCEMHLEKGLTFITRTLLHISTWELPLRQGWQGKAGQAHPCAAVKRRMGHNDCSLLTGCPSSEKRTVEWSRVLSAGRK